MSRRETKPRWILWLVYLVILTALAVSVTLARYTSQVTGTATAQVARVAMGVADSAFTLNLADIKVPGDTQTFTFSVVNFTGSAPNQSISEVTQSYTVTLTTTGNLPLTYTLAASDIPAGQTGVTPWPAAATGPSLSAGGGLLPHTTASTHTYVLTVTWPAASNSPALADEIDSVTVTVHAEQVTPTP